MKNNITINKLISLTTAIALIIMTKNSLAGYKDELRSAIIKDISSKEGIQYVDFGPMKDGRMIKVDISFHNDANKSSLPIVYGGIGHNHYKIEIPRSKIIKSFFIIDATLACYVEKNICSSIPKYLDIINNAENTSKIPFIDDLNTNFEKNLSEFRRSEIWGGSILNGIGTITAMCTLHEIGHIALGHNFKSKTVPEDVIMKQEAEADGFALKAFELASINVSPALILLLPDLYEEETLGYFSFTHPNPSCRIKAYIENVQNWSSKNDESIDEGTRSFFNKSKLDELIKTILNNNNDCDLYIKNMHKGQDAASKLIDKNTEIISSPY